MFENVRRKLSLAIFFLMIFTGVSFAEYRAYLIEVYDHIEGKKWDAVTGFSPDQYVLTHGGAQRLSFFIKATWHCYGDTSRYEPACPMPSPKQPKFQKGDTVKVILDKHVTDGWKGVVELSLYRSELKSNVYGVRFGKKKVLYNRYYEFNLVKPKLIPKASQGDN